MHPVLLALGAGAAALGGYAVYRKKHGQPVLPAALQPAPPAVTVIPPAANYPPLQSTPDAPDAGQVKGVQPGAIILATTVQPNGSGADLTLQVTAVNGGVYDVVPGDQAELVEYSGYGIVYPTQVGSVDVIRIVSNPGATVSGQAYRRFGGVYPRPPGSYGVRIGMNPQPLPPSIFRQRPNYFLVNQSRGRFGSVAFGATSDDVTARYLARRRANARHLGR